MKCFTEYKSRHCSTASLETKASWKNRLQHTCHMQHKNIAQRVIDTYCQSSCIDCAAYKRTNPKIPLTQQSLHTWGKSIRLLESDFCVRAVYNNHRGVPLVLFFFFFFSLFHSYPWKYIFRARRRTAFRHVIFKSRRFRFIRTPTYMHYKYMCSLASGCLRHVLHVHLAIEIGRRPIPRDIIAFQRAASSYNRIRVNCNFPIIGGSSRALCKFINSAGEWELLPTGVARQYSKYNTFTARVRQPMADKIPFLRALCSRVLIAPPGDFAVRYMLNAVV